MKHDIACEELELSDLVAAGAFGDTLPFTALVDHLERRVHDELPELSAPRQPPDLDVDVEQLVRQLTDLLEPLPGDDALAIGGKQPDRQRHEDQRRRR